MASVKNTLIVAMMQVGVIVAGVLAAGICHKMWLSSGMAMPLPVAMLYRHGAMGLCVPLVWGAGTVMLQLRARVSDDIKALVFWLGVLVLIGLVVFCVYADVTPWLNVMWNLSGDGDN